MVFIAILFVVLAIYSLVRLAPFHPVQLWSIPWSIAVTTYAAGLLPYIQLSLGAGAFLVASQVAVVGGLLVAGRRRSDDQELPPDAATPLRWAALAAVGLTAVGVLAFVIEASTLFGLDRVLAASADVRQAIGGGDLAFSVKYVYLALAATTLTAAKAGLAEDRRSRRGWLALAAVSCATIYLATGRATLLSGLIAAFVAYFLFRARPVPRKNYLLGLGGGLIVALVAFLIGGLLVGKTFANNTDLADLSPDVLAESNFRLLMPAYQYVSAPVAGLEVQYQVSQDFGGSFGCATSPEACTILSAAGLDVPTVERVRPFTGEPLIWNTFTALDAPLVDWGPFLAPIVLLLVGVGMGVSWARARRSVAAALIYAGLAPALALGFNSFAFTAPHLVAGCLIAVTLLAGARLATNRRADRGSVAPPATEPPPG